MAAMVLTRNTDGELVGDYYGPGDTRPAPKNLRSFNQQVYLSQLQDGRYGLFTNRFLVISLRNDEVPNAKAIAERMGFEYVEKK